jgi:hypothetical protein
MSRFCIYFIKPSAKDRWFKGDAKIRNLIRRVVRGKPSTGGVQKVFINLCKGLDLINQPYEINLPFSSLNPEDKVAILGSGHQCLDGYNKPNKIVAGIGLMTHPKEWPDLCEKFPVVKYLQHSDWANNIYKPYFGDKCKIWPVGIETKKWKPDLKIEKKYDILIYNKIRWEHKTKEKDLLTPIRNFFKYKKVNFREIKYGEYLPADFKMNLIYTKAMVFLCEHESQGIAYQEALSMNVPIFAWDQGSLIDPNYKIWGDENTQTTSVPYFDDRCGMKFKDFSEFETNFDSFISKVKNKAFAPREYVMENLTLEICAQKFVDIVKSI